VSGLSGLPAARYIHHLDGTVEFQSKAPPFLGQLEIHRYIVDARDGRPYSEFEEMPATQAN
jgi:hypothetical protein